MNVKNIENIGLEINGMLLTDKYNTHPPNK